MACGYVCCEGCVVLWVCEGVECLKCGRPVLGALLLGVKQR